MRIDRASLPFVGLLAVVTLLMAWLLPRVVPVPIALLGFTLWFFRDPDRSAPGRAGAVLSPADGRVIVAGPERISVFMNVFNVHVCRAPVAGRVETVVHVPGRFLAAFKDEASDHNERTSIVLDSGAGRLRFTLVAGLIARRIVCRIAPSQVLHAGERVGLIRFGSRVDVDLPAGAVSAVRVGDRVAAGVTVIAEIA